MSVGEILAVRGAGVEGTVGREQRPTARKTGRDHMERAPGRRDQDNKLSRQTLRFGE